MKVFISSRVQGMEEFRDAASSAISGLGYKPVRSEDFAATPSTPQAACLSAVRDADVVVLILGADYGTPQASGLSPTHEEYREARESQPVLVFVQANVVPTGAQVVFIDEVQGWEAGHYTSSFQDADDLRTRVTRGLHEYVLDSSSSTVDDNALLETARRLVPTGMSTGHTMLVLAVAAGPSRQVLRPAELHDQALQNYLKHQALTGDNSVFDLSLGTVSAIRGETIVLEQSDRETSVTVSETGSVVVQSALREDYQRAAIPSIIKEDFVERLDRAIRFVGTVLDHVDQQQRLSHVVPVAALLNASYRPWRTRREQALNPNSATMNLSGQGRIVVNLTPAARRRPAFLQESRQLAEDLTVRLRHEAGLDR